MPAPPSLTLWPVPTGVVQSAVSATAAGPYVIANRNVSLVHGGFTSAELFLDRDSFSSDADDTKTDGTTAYLVYSSPYPGHQARAVVELLSANWTASAGKASAPFGESVYQHACIICHALPTCLCL